MTDTAHLNIKVTQNGTAQVTNDLGRLTVTAGSAEVRVNSFTRAMQNSGRTANELSRINGRLDASLQALISVAMIKRIMDYSDAWTSLTNKLIVVKREHEDLAAVQKGVFDVAQRTRSDLATTAQLYSRLAQAMASTGANSEQVLRLTETLNKALIVSGATAAERSAALLQFSQAMASGVLRGDEFRSVAEQAPKITQVLAQALNTNIGGLRELAYSGKLTADVVLEAMSKAAEGIDAEFSKTLPTLSQNFAMAQNNITRFVGESQTARSGVMAFSSAILGLSNNMDVVINVAGVLLTIMGAKMLTSFGARTAAVFQSAAADARQAATIRQVQAVMQSSLGTTAQAAVATSRKTAADLQLARAQYNVAKGTQNEAIAFAQLNQALIANRAATLSTIQAKAALQAQLNTVTGAATRAATAMRLLNGVMGLLGGPVGVIMLGAGALWSWNEASKAATQESLSYGESLDGLTESLGKMTAAQLQATAVEAQRQIPKMKEEIEDITKSIDAEQKAIVVYERMLQRGIKSESEEKDILKRLETAKQNVILKTRDLETWTNNLTNAQQLNANAMTMSIAKLFQLGMAANKVSNTKVDLGMDKAVLETLDRKISDVNIDLKENQLITKGNKEQGYAYGRVMTDLGKHAQEYKDVVEGVVFGTMSLTDAESKSNKAFVEKIQTLNKAHQENYKLQFGIKQTTKAENASAKEIKQTERVLEEYANRIAEVKIELEESAQKRAQLTAEHKLGTNATKEEVLAVRALADELYKLEEQRKKAQKIPEQRKKATDIVESGKGEENFAEIDAKEKQKLDLMTSYQQQDLANTQIYEDAKTAISRDAAQQRENLQKVLLNRMVSFSQDSMGIITEGLAQATSEQNFIYKAMFAAQKAMQIPSILANTETAAAAALAWGTQQGGPAMGMTMAGIVKALGYTAAATVGGLAIAGMAHDGIDNIPKEGTWLLQKGERVLNAPSNDKLNRFLDNSSTTSKQTINQNFYFGSGKVDNETLALIKQAAEQGAQGGYDLVKNDFANNGDAYKLMTRGG